MPHHPTHRFVLIFLFAFCGRSAAYAQDIHAAPLVWLTDDDTPEVLPVARGLPSMEVSVDMKTIHEPAYAEYRFYVPAKGEGTVTEVASTCPWLKIDFRNGDRDFVPAKREGKSVESEVTLTYIYNPAEADPKKADAIPRLLTIRPPLSPPWNPKPLHKQRIIRVRAAIDDTGRVTATTALPENPPLFAGAAAFAEAAAVAVKSWVFAPARQSGKPVATELEVNVVFLPPPAKSISEVDTGPKPIRQIQPSYPRGLAAAGISGQVVIEFVISVEGRVTNPAVVSSSHPAFEEPAIAAVREWRFIPASKQGHPVNLFVSQQISFTLDGKELQDFKISAPKTFPPNLPEALRFEVPPHLEYMEQPVYPIEDLQAKRGGKVTLVYVVGPDGKVAEISVMPGAPSPSLAAAAAAALENFRFTPPGRHGKPCSAMLRIDLEFSPSGNVGHSPVTASTRRVLSLLEKAPQKLVHVQALDQPPTLRSGNSPHAGPTSSGSGEATIEFVIDQDGIPRVPRIVSASEPALAYAAIQAISNWRFTSPRAGGKYVDALIRTPFIFKK